MRSWWLVLPPLLFGLLLLLVLGLKEDPREIPSPLVGKPLPLLVGENLLGEPVSIGGKPLAKPVLLNVWASWCIACLQEHPVMMRGAEKYGDRIDFIGVNYRDERDKGIQWLSRYGNPYQWSYFDEYGRAGLELGVYGAPETFFVNIQGEIIHKQVGPFDMQTLDQKIARFFMEGP